MILKSTPREKQQLLSKLTKLQESAQTAGSRLVKFLIAVADACLFRTFSWILVTFGREFANR